jgi:hypothetical protein
MCASGEPTRPCGHESKGLETASAGYRRGRSRCDSIRPHRGHAKIRSITPSSASIMMAVSSSVVHLRSAPRAHHRDSDQLDPPISTEERP